VIFPTFFPAISVSVGIATAKLVVTVRPMLNTITEAAERLRVHRSTIYKLMKNDPTFPSFHYIRPRCPRLKVSDLDRWVASKAPTGDLLYVSPDLYTGRARGARSRQRRAS
jgi:predicted DNA-binding transcriptional regulator AlpA